MSLEHDVADREERLQEILLAYLEAQQEGRAPDRRQLLNLNPEFAADIQEFFSSRDCLERTAAPLRAAVKSLSSRSNRVSGSGSRLGDSSGGGRGSLASSLGQLPELGLIGDFRLIREIGRGGMGIVYEAQQISLNRRVALKVLPFAAALDAKQLQRFKNEAQAAALLHHPHIVPVHAVGVERGVHYYAMQFIEGQSLAALIQELRQQAAIRAEPGKPLASSSSRPTSPQDKTRASAADLASTERTTHRPAFFRKAVEWALMAAEALEHAHQQGVVHRDVKPANLLLDAPGCLWVTDFGLALFQSNAGLTMTGELVGTLRYMSPEQAGAQRGWVDHRTDIYSLGVTLYELLTLRPVFSGQDRHTLMHQVLFDDPAPVRSLDKSIPVELETILLKATAKVPAERYATAGELAQDLRRYLEDKPVLARRPTLLDRTAKWAKRHRPLVLCGLGSLFVLVGALAVSIVLIARERAKERESFVQAKQAVDSLVRISEEELDDSPSLQMVRKRLLETALEYYQDFIGQRDDDPSIQKERDRIGGILKELSNLHGGGRWMLLTQKSVQEDLDLTDDQVKRIALFSEANTQNLRDAFRNFRHLGAEEKQQKFRALAESQEATALASLTPAQQKRLGQIDLQNAGHRAFSQPDVIDALKLTPDQRKRIRPIQQEVGWGWWEFSQLSGKPPDDPRAREEGRKRAQELKKEATDKIVAILTEAQQATYREMTGKPFDGKIQLGPGGGVDRRRRQ